MSGDSFDADEQYKTEDDPDDEETAVALQCHKLASATEKVKESLVGTDEIEPGTSDSMRTEFMAHAVKDEETGEH